MTGKYIRVTMLNGEVWDVPAELIAKHRASKIALQNGKDSETRKNEVYSVEFNYTMDNEEVLFKYATEHFNWSDVLPHSRRVKPPQNMGPDGYQKGWVMGHKEVVIK